MDTCATCRFFSGNDESVNLNWRSVCRRFPPGSAPGRTSSLYVPVSSEYWCGEYQAVPIVEPKPVVDPAPEKRKPGRPKKEPTNA